LWRVYQLQKIGYSSDTDPQRARQKKIRKKKVARLVLLHELVKFQVQSTVVFGRLPNQERQLPPGPTNFT
jgi:hypothetical protein